ncbi:MAG: nucleotide exchange factor GrpE [Minisyncoccia bacterium]|jgi:molecular chaperone GrpE
MAEENKDKLTFAEFYKQNCSSIPKEGKEEWEVVNEFYKEQLQKCNDEKNEYLAGWQRAKADFINYKKEEFAHLQEVAQYGSIDLIRDFITVLDNFDLGLRALEKNGTVDKGVYLIRSQIEDILKKRGLTKIIIKPGDPFDPAVAEAMTEVESEQSPGAIVEEIEPGYKLHDKVLRAARVIISKQK